MDLEMWWLALAGSGYLVDLDMLWVARATRAVDLEWILKFGG